MGRGSGEEGVLPLGTPGEVSVVAAVLQGVVREVGWVALGGETSCASLRFGARSRAGTPPIIPPCGDARRACSCPARVSVCSFDEVSPSSGAGSAFGRMVRAGLVGYAVVVRRRVTAQGNDKLRGRELSSGRSA